MRWVMKGEGMPLHASSGWTRPWSRLRPFAATRAGVGRRPQRWAFDARACSLAVPRTKARFGRLRWDVAIDPFPPKVSTAWCANAATLQAAILARAPVAVLPAQVPGTAVLDQAAAMLGPAALFISLGSGTFQALSSTPGPAGHAATDEVERVRRALAAEADGAAHVVVTVDGADTLSPDALAWLQRLPCRGMPDIQVALAGGSELYGLLADGRIHDIREEARAAAVPVAPYGMDPAINHPAEATPHTGWQRLGAAVSVVAVAALMIGPLLGLMPRSGTEAAKGSAAPAAVAAMSVAPTPAPPMAVAASPAPAEDPAAAHARPRREAAAAHAPAGRRLFPAERVRGHAAPSRPDLAARGA